MAADVRLDLVGDWLWGWDLTPGIVSVWAEGDGRATIWRRVDGELVCEQARFRPWLVVDEELHRPPPRVTCRRLEGEGELRYLLRGDDLRVLTAAVLDAESRRAGKRVGHLRELGERVIALPPEEQYLVASGRAYFRGLELDDVRRLQLDLETTGLDAERDRVFLIAVRDPSGKIETIEAAGDTDAAEAEVIARLVARVRAHDPDVIENHNLHGFDLPFLDRRARRLGVPLSLGRIAEPTLRTRGARRGAPRDGDPTRRIRYVAPGRELIDTLDAVLRHDFATRELPDHGLKAVARHLGLARSDRELVPGDRVHEVYRQDPARVRRYAGDDVDEVAGLARLLGGAAFALARMVPRRYERIADAGPATGIIDPLLVRAYLRAGAALPAHRRGDGTEHTGAGLHLFAAGVARRVVKADVASLYPSLMRAYRIGSGRDRLGVMLALVDELVERRLQAKARARAAPRGSAERHGQEALSAAMKLVVNSAYGYLGAGGMTRFSDVHAANEITRRGREVLDLLCRELEARGVTLLEADTDGVYFAVPASWDEADERRIVAEVAALLPPLVRLEYDGRYTAMLSHEPKNYALLGYDGKLVLRGVAFRSSRAEPFGERFLRAAVGRLLEGDIPGLRAAYLDAVAALRRREPTCHDLSSSVRLTRPHGEYMQTRGERRELVYEALLAAGRTTWSVGDRVRVYRTTGGGGALPGDPDLRDYDVEHYERVLRDTFASRLARALTPDDFATVLGDVDQLSLFATPLGSIRTILTVTRRQ